MGDVVSVTKFPIDLERGVAGDLNHNKTENSSSTSKFALQGPHSKLLHHEICFMLLNLSFGSGFNSCRIAMLRLALAGPSALDGP